MNSFRPDPQVPGGAGGHPSTLSSRAAGAKKGRDERPALVRGPQGGAGIHYRKREQQSGSSSQTRNEPGSGADPSATYKPWEDMFPGERRDAVFILRKGHNKSVTQIAAILQCTRNCIIGTINRMRASGMDVPNTTAYKPKKNRIGTAALLERLVELRAERMSVGAIAEELGYTRTRIDQLVRMAKDLGMIEDRKRMKKEAPVLTGPVDNARDYIRADAFDPIPGHEPVAAFSPGCKWPVDGLDGPGMMWCGCKRVPAKPYCEAHLERSKSKRRPKEIVL